MAEVSQLIGAIGRQSIELGGDEYVFDSKRNIWVNKESSEPANPFIQKIIKDTYAKVERGRAASNLNTRSIAKSYGIAGSAVIGRANPTILVAANNDEPVLPQELAINRPLVKMINVLASIDGFLKQRLDNQKVIGRNAQLSSRESQIEYRDSQPQIDVIKPDAEKVDGSSAGLLALGGLALLTLDPVQEALKDIVDGVISMGRFVTGVVSSINSVFKFLLGGDSSSSNTVPEVQAPEGGVGETPAAEPVEGAGAVPTPAQSSSPAAAPENKSSFLSNVGSAALTGATVGSIVPRVGPAIGAVVGGAIGAVTHFTGGSSSDSGGASDATQTSAPPVSSSSSSSKPETENPDATQEATQAGEIPKNDIVALGNYLASKGADKSKMEHMALSGRVGEHSENSRHYRGMAIDVNFPGANEASILDALEPQLRAAGYNTIWRKPDHYTHMHVSTGGPEGSGGGAYGDSSGSLGSAVASVAAAGLEQVGKLFGVLGSAVIKPGVARTDVSSVIASAAKETNADIAISKTPPAPPSMPPMPAPPNINKIDGGATQNPATPADKNSVYYYLRRFGYQDLSVPEPKAVIA